MTTHVEMLSLGLSPGESTGSAVFRYARVPPPQAERGLLFPFEGLVSYKPYGSEDVAFLLKFDLEHSPSRTLVDFFG